MGLLMGLGLGFRQAWPWILLVRILCIHRLGVMLLFVSEG